MWLIPFKGRNYSGHYSLNFLWNDKNIYIMDNHRAALWCWFQHLQEKSLVDFLHIDRHTDTLQANLDDLVKVCPDLWKIELEEYLQFKIDSNTSTETPLFSWENYGSIFFHKYRQLVDSCRFVTHGKGDAPNFNGVLKSEIWDTAGNISFWLGESNNNWIVNLDLDFFFYPSDTENYSVLVSDEYLEQLISGIKDHLDGGKILCLTISLSPECCGGWQPAERLCNKVTDILNLDFSLPE